MNRLTAAFALCLFPLAATQANAPRAINEAECRNYADLAGVARALAQVNTSRAAAGKAITLIYKLPDERSEQLAQIVLDAAYSAL